MNIALRCALHGSSLDTEIRRAFSNGEQGWVHDPSDITTLFQDFAGTTPVTALEQPVGLMLDKRLGLVPGPNTYAPFSLDPSAVVVGSRIQITNSPAGGTIVATSNVTILEEGKWYSVVCRVTSLSAGSLFLVAEGGSPVSATITSPQTLRMTFRAPSPGNFYAVATGCTASIESISVRELPGHHAFQTTAINRPTFSARVNQLTKSEDFSDWFIAGSASMSTSADPAPSGSSFWALLSATASDVAGVFNYVEPAVSENVRYRTSFHLKPNTTGWAYIRSQFNSDIRTAWFNVSTGQIGTVESGITAQIEPVPGGGYRCSVERLNATAGAFTYAFVAVCSADANFFASVGDSIKVWGADVRPANQANLPYQRVNTATDYDFAGFPKYLATNGVNQWMQTADVNLTGSDRITVVAGVRKLSDVAQAFLVFSTDPTANNGTFGIYAGSAVGDWRNLAGSASAYALRQTNFPVAPATSVFSGQQDRAAAVGSKISNRIDGAEIADTEVSVGTISGNYGSYPLYIGAQAGTSLFFNGQFYGSVANARPSGVTPAERALFERFVNRNTRVTLAS